MIEVSVVTGTYNRLASLKRMVNSVRSSAGDIRYEIVLVDGGSNDGTIEWCKEQPDVVLIEHGGLYGAVRAFNDGAKKARGRYVILANDDVYFIDESILHAYTFMEKYISSVGIGCFHQNRNNKPWHVEQMPAVSPTGEQVSVAYGQVCIVPKWLGDSVGWWGDYLHTYGGDNELSARIWELGYIAAPVPCACIADMMIHDDLRSRNGGDPQELIQQGIRHPDSQKWQEKWNRDGKTGPRIAASPTVPTELKPRTRIMYMPLFEPGNNFQRTTKVGLRKALEKRGSVLQLDYVVEGLDILYDRAVAFQPNILVFQIQNVDPFNAAVIRELKEALPQATFVNWNGDFHPNNFMAEPYIEMMKEFHLAGFVTVAMADKYDEAEVPWFYWQIGYEESSAHPNADTPSHDIVYLGNCYTEARKLLGDALRSMSTDNGWNLGLYGIWPKGWAAGQNLYDFNEGQRLYRNAKFAISTQQYPDGIGFVSNRLIQATAAGGAMVLQQYFEGMEEYLGFKEGKHLRVWSTMDELAELIRYYISNDDERRAIAEAGHAFTLQNHSFDVRVNELFDELETI